MRGFNTLLFVMFALSANAADGTVGTVSVQKGNNVSVNGEAHCPRRLTARIIRAASSYPRGPQMRTMSSRGKK